MVVTWRWWSVLAQPALGGDPGRAAGRGAAAAAAARTRRPRGPAPRVAEAQGALRSAVVDPLTGLEDTLAANGEALAAARVAAEGDGLGPAQRALARRAAWGGAMGSLLTQAALLGVGRLGAVRSRASRPWRWR